MTIFSKALFKPLFFILVLTNVNLLVAEDNSEIDFNNNASLKGNNLHPQLNALYKRNQFMTIQLTTRNKSLDKIISTLKKLDDKINYKINSNTTPNNSNNLTMADFNTMDDDLIRKCDEIVDNYYSRKTQQEKNYVQQLYNTEQNDPQWELYVENQIQNFIDNNNLNQSAFFDINCKSSVCKFRVQHTTSEASQQFKGQLREEREFKIYNSQNKFDRITGGIITNITLVKDEKKLREFVWGE